MSESSTFVLLPTSNMVEIVRLRIPWSIFQTYARQYSDKLQWKLNRERLMRHKIHHRLSDLSEQELYEHYMTHIKPRSTRIDVGKPRVVHTSRTSSMASSMVAGAVPLPLLTLDAIVEPSCSGELDSRSSCIPPSTGVIGADGVFSSDQSSIPAAQSSVFPNTGVPPQQSTAVLEVMAEVAALRRTVDQLDAVLMEQRSHQTDWERRVSLELARLESAIALASPASALVLSHTASAFVNNDVKQSEEAGFDPCVRFGLKRRRVNVVVQLDGTLQSVASASLLLPALIQQVPQAVQNLLKGDDFCFEPMATPTGINNVLWAYALTEPMGASACESKCSVREHMRRESCLINVRWNEDLLKEYDTLVKGEDHVIDASCFLEWKARVSHSAISIFHSDRPHQMINPLYLNVYSRVLYRRADGCYIALIPRSTNPGKRGEQLFARVHQHMKQLFNMGESPIEDDTQVGGLAGEA